MSITPPGRPGPAANVAQAPTPPAQVAEGRPVFAPPPAGPGNVAPRDNPELELVIPLGGVRPGPSIRGDCMTLTDVTDLATKALAMSSNGRVWANAHLVHPQWTMALVDALRATADDAMDALEASDPAQGRLAAWLSHQYAEELAALGTQGTRNEIVLREIGINALDALSDAPRIEGPAAPVVPRGTGPESVDEEHLTPPPTPAELTAQMEAVDRAYAAAAAAARAGDAAAYLDAKGSLNAALSNLDETLYNLRIDAVGPVFAARLLRLEEGLRRAVPEGKELGLVVDSPSALLAAQRLLGLSR